MRVVSPMSAARQTVELVEIGLGRDRSYLHQTLNTGSAQAALRIISHRNVVGFARVVADRCRRSRTWRTPARISVSTRHVAHGVVAPLVDAAWACFPGRIS